MVTHPFLQLSNTAQLIMAFMLLASFRVFTQVNGIDEVVQEGELGGDREFLRQLHRHQYTPFAG